MLEQTSRKRKAATEAITSGREQVGRTARPDEVSAAGYVFRLPVPTRTAAAGPGGQPLRPPAMPRVAEGMAALPSSAAAWAGEEIEAAV